jgi:hypothetical protein
MSKPNFTTLILVAAALVAGVAPSQARSVHTDISMGTFKGRCSAAGGELLPRSGGWLCILPSGAAVQCFSDSGGGLNCDIMASRTGKMPKGLGGVLGLQNLNMQ